MVEKRRWRITNPTHLEDLVTALLIQRGENSTDSPTLQNQIKTQDQLEAAFEALVQEMGTKAHHIMFSPINSDVLVAKAKEATTPEELQQVITDITEAIEMMEEATEQAEIMKEFTADLEVFVAESKGELAISDKVKQYLMEIAQRYSIIELDVVTNQAQFKARLRSALLEVKQKAANFLDQSEA